MSHHNSLSKISEKTKDIFDKNEHDDETLNSQRCQFPNRFSFAFPINKENHLYRDDHSRKYHLVCQKTLSQTNIYNNHDLGNKVLTEPPCPEEEPSRQRQESSSLKPKKSQSTDVKQATQSKKSAQNGVKPEKVKLFEEKINTTPQGDAFATVIESSLKELFRKDRILDLLTNPEEIESIRKSGWLISKPPRLPPLVTEKACFAFYVDDSECKAAKDLFNDDLRPWQFRKDPSDTNSISIQPFINRRYYEFLNGTWKIVNYETKFYLTEHTGRLPREERLRKKIYYLSQDNQVWGNMLIIYSYENPGNAPMPFIESVPVDKEEILEKVGPAMMHPDNLMDGDDVEKFNRNSIKEPDSRDWNPYHNEARKLSTGHVYLTVRDKKTAMKNENIMNWIANTPTVERENLLNNTKPLHPPLVRNSRAYAFFVSATAILPHNVTRDELSPWSGNANAENPICYRTSVEKLGVEADPNSSVFLLKDGDYRKYPFYLVYVYSINPKVPRLRKRIYYVMDAILKKVVSHALIIYDYIKEGQIPKLNLDNRLLSNSKNGLPAPNLHDDVSDGEENRDCPFTLPVETDVDGSLYMRLNNQEFWNDRNRQLQYLVNHPELLENMKCLNNDVPDGPTALSESVTLAFFIDEDVDRRPLTIDKLCPWSENKASNSTKTVQHINSHKWPLGMNRHNELRAYKPKDRYKTTDDQFFMYVYNAVHPHCTRLRKRIVYVLRNGQPYGHSLIMYSYANEKETSQSLKKTFYQLSVASESTNLNGVGPTTSTPVGEIDINKDKDKVEGEEIDEHSEKNEHGVLEGDNYVPERTGVDEAGPTTSSNMETVSEQFISKDKRMVEVEAMTEHFKKIESNIAHENPVSNRNEAVPVSVGKSENDENDWQKAQKLYGTNDDKATFEKLFQMLLKNNKQLLFRRVREEQVAADQLSLAAHHGQPEHNEH